MDKRGQMFLTEKVVNILEGVIAVTIIGLFIYIFFLRPFLENTELKQAEATLNKIKAEIETLVGKTSADGFYAFNDGKSIVYYKLTPETLTWGIDGKNWYDSKLIPDGKGGLIDVVDNNIISKQGFDIFISLQRAVNNPDKLDIVRKIISTDNLRSVRLGFFVTGPKLWFVTSWPHQDIKPEYNDDAIKPVTCKSNYCLCMCKANSENAEFRLSWRGSTPEDKKKIVGDCKVCVEINSNVNVLRYSNVPLKGEINNDDAILINGVTEFDIVEEYDINGNNKIKLIRRAFQ